MTFFHIGKEKFRRFGIMTLIMFLLINEAFICSISGEEDIHIQSKGCAIMDGNTGRILFEKDGNKALSNASTTKILTCIIALENGKKEDEVVFSKEASAQPEVKLGIGEGNSLSLEEILLCMMLESYNDCAYAIAEHIGGTKENFARMMNDKAEELGTEDSYFVTPNGLDGVDEQGEHHSTAEDLCRIMRYCCMESPASSEFIEICEKRSASVTGSNGVGYSIVNRNRLLYSDIGNLAGKTGYTSKAGYCYVGYFREKQRTYFIAVLGCGWPGNNVRWKEVQSLLAYARKRYILYRVESPEIIEKMEVVCNGYRGKPTLAQWKERNFLSYRIEGGDFTFQMNSEESLERKVNIEELIESACYDEVIGTLEYEVGGKKLAYYQIKSTEKVYKWNNMALFRAILNFFYT